jgi:hypothetical protein
VIPLVRECQVVAVEPARRILESPLVKRKEEFGLPYRKRPKQQKKNSQQSAGKIDIKV